MPRTTLLLPLLAVALSACSTSPPAPEGEVAQLAATEERNVGEWSLPGDQSRPAIEGYDPVAYFPEGGGAAQKGSPAIALNYGGVLYYFASAMNRDRFEANPSRYEPAHGGWCSWAMRDGTKTEINPKSFIVRDGRLFLFYDGLWGDTRALWLETDHGTSTDAADGQWQSVSGEEPRRGDR